MRWNCRRSPVGREARRMGEGGSRNSNLGGQSGEAYPPRGPRRDKLITAAVGGSRPLRPQTRSRGWGCGPQTLRITARYTYRLSRSICTESLGRQQVLIRAIAAPTRLTACRLVLQLVQNRGMSLLLSLHWRIPCTATSTAFSIRSSRWSARSTGHPRTAKRAPETPVQPLIAPIT